MVLEEIKQIKSSKKDLRNFGITIGIVLLLIAGFLFFKEKELFQTFLYIAGAFVVIGLILPTILKPIYLIWMTFAVIIGWIMTRVILSLFYYTIITSIGVIMRTFGKDFIDKTKVIYTDSYWNQRDGDIEKNQDLEKQF